MQAVSANALKDITQISADNYARKSVRLLLIIIHWNLTILAFSNAQLVYMQTQAPGDVYNGALRQHINTLITRQINV
jgi:hypothetical protein